MMARVTKIFAKGREDSGLPDSGSVLGALSVPLFVVDEEGCISFVNQAAEQFFASSRNNLIGRPLLDFLPEDRPGPRPYLNRPARARSRSPRPALP